MTPKDTYEQIYTKDPAVFGTTPSSLVLELADLLPQGSTVLDLGAGQGKNAFYLANKGYRVTAVELTETGCQQMRDTAAKEGISLDACIEGDITSPEILAQLKNYDAILCINVLPLLTEEGVERVIAAIGEKTNPRGYMVISAFMVESPGKRQVYVDKGKYRFVPEELRVRFSDFSIVSAYDEGLSHKLC
ncbi:MAG: methyltransferase domain-containing protein [Nanoarchaeota archaeon]